jgi:hypothetical protein
VTTVGGSCLCGGVRYEVELPFRRANHCHCSRCRKQSGTFGGTQGRIAKERVRLLEGEELLTVYEPAPGAARKVFCQCCGSSVFGGFWPDGDDVSVRFGTLDGDPQIKPQYHSFVDSRAPWDELPDDGLPRYPRAPPAP